MTFSPFSNISYRIQPKDQTSSGLDNDSTQYTSDVMEIDIREVPKQLEVL